MDRLVVVSAAPFEAQAFMETRSFRAWRGLYLCCGIGALNADKAEAELGRRCAGSLVVFIGTCGSFYPFPAPGSAKGLELVSASWVEWLPPCVRAGLAASIEGLHPPQRLVPAPPWLDLPRRRVLCSPSISQHDDCRRHPSALGYPTDELVENLELYSCIQGISSQAAAVAVVLAVTNQVGSSGREQWRSHHQEAARASARYLESRLPPPPSRP